MLDIYAKLVYNFQLPIAFSAVPSALLAVVSEGDALLRRSYVLRRLYSMAAFRKASKPMATFRWKLFESAEAI